MCVFCLAFVTRGADSDAGVHTTVTTAVLCCAVLGWAGLGRGFEKTFVTHGSGER